MMGLYTFVALNLSILDPVAKAIKDFSFTDIYYKALEEVPDTSHAITIVDMSKMYTRTEVAQLLYDIESTKPKLVGVDITFQDERTDFWGNDMLVDIAKTYSNIVFAYYRQNANNGKQSEVHSFFTDSIPVNEGFTDMPRGLYGVMKRKIPLASKKQNGKEILSFPSVVTNLYTNHDIVNTTDTTDLSINFYPTVFTIIEADSVLIHPEMLEGRIVLVGGVNRLEDMHDTPLGKMAGTVLLAYSIKTILEQSQVESPAMYWIIIVSFILIYCTLAGQEMYCNGIKRIVKNEKIQNILITQFIVGILTSLWTTFLLGLDFLLFCKTCIHINLGWTFVGISLLTTCDGLYTAIFTNKKQKRKTA